MADQTYEYVGVKPNEESPNGACALELPKDFKISPMPMTDTKSYVIYSSLVSVEFMISTLSLIFYVALKASPVLIILSAAGLAALALGCLLSYQAVSTSSQRRQTFALVVFVIATMVCSATSIVALTMATEGSIQYTTSTTSNARTLYQNGYPYNSYYYDPYNSYPDYSNPYGSYNNNPYDGGYNPYDGGYNPYDGGYPYGGYGGYPYGGYNPYGGNPYNNYGNCPYSYGYPSTFTVHSSYFVAYTSGNIKYTYTYNYDSSSGPLGSQYSSYSYSHNLDCTTGHDDYTSASNSWSSTSYTNPYGGTYNYYNPYTGAIYSYASYNSPEPMSFEEGPGLILNGGNRFDDKMFTIVLFALKSLVFVGLIAQGISLRKSLTAKKRTQPLQQPQKIDMSGEVRKI